MKFSVETPVVGRSSDLQALKIFLLAVASQFAPRTSACVTAFVPAYRCGTVPDSHRIPLADNDRETSTHMQKAANAILGLPPLLLLRRGTEALPVFVKHAVPSVIQRTPPWNPPRIIVISTALPVARHSTAIPHRAQTAGAQTSTSQARRLSISRRSLRIASAGIALRSIRRRNRLQRHELVHLLLQTPELRQKRAFGINTAEHVRSLLKKTLISSAREIGDRPL